MTVIDAEKTTETNQCDLHQ